MLSGKLNKTSVLWLCGILMSTCVSAFHLTPVKLTCEYVENPLGLDKASPRFSWVLDTDKRNQFQSAYELQVSDREGAFEKNNAGWWSAGKIVTAQNLHIVYSGRPLQSFKRYYWRVRVYDQDGNISGWSKTAWFETAALSDVDWQAKWISDGKPSPDNPADYYKDDQMPVFRKTFTPVKKIASARLYVAGLGYYEAYLNGKKIGDHQLDPGWTNYDKEILYAVYDVTGMLQKGINTAGLMLGNGWYNVLPMRMWGRINLRDELATGRPCVKAQFRITYADGTIETVFTDNTWQMAPGPIVRNSVYSGEQYDARLEPAGWMGNTALLKGWQGAIETQGPSGKLIAQLQPPVRITKVIQPGKVTQTTPGTYLFDMGQNFAGAVRIKVKGPSGTRIVLRYGEDKYKDSGINVMTAVAGQIKKGNGGPGAPRIAWQEDSYTLSGKGVEVWAPRFTFHGFRYVEVTGWPGVPSLQDIEGLRMNTAVERTGNFSSSNTMFNRLDEITDWTFLSNLFSVQSDCPAREKFGYGGDMFATAESYLYRYDMANFYRKTIRDFTNDQRPMGGMTETVPYVGIADKSPGDSAGPIGWQLAFPYLIKQLYDFYGDRQIIEENYPALVRQAAFLEKTAIDSLHYRDISDHEALDVKPEGLSAAVFYLHHIQLLAEFATITGQSADADHYNKSAAAIKQVINDKYLVANTGKFDNATQSAQILALYYHLAPDKEKEKVITQLMNEFERHHWHVATGIFSTKMMFDVLRENNYNDIAYRIADQRDFPGWGHMIAHGATTLWETWAYSDNVYSQNHPMFGSVSEWFYRSLLGINAGAPGFEKIIIKPQPAGNLSSAAGSYQSIRGKISSAWKTDQQRFSLHVVIPANTTAEIWMPATTVAGIKESGKPAQQAEGITFLKMENGYAVFKTGGGTYAFEANWKTIVD